MRHPKSKARRLLHLLLTSALVVLATGFVWRSLLAGPGGTRARALGKVLVTRTSFLQGARPSLEGGVGWINSAPIRIEDLRGKIVLLDFWTYCCINCHHILPDLAKLEEKYKNDLVVIGVHTAKFFAERDTENIRQKVREYQIKHPVINDADQVLWTNYGVNSWPTLVLIDVDGSYVGSVSGEGHYAVLDRVIGQLVAKHKAKGDLDEKPLVFFPESEKGDATPLSYPGKVLADAKGKRLFISDTSHNRIVQTDLEGKNPRVIGNGNPGLVDGDYAKAEFNRPQGMCLVEEVLYVADTENHALRAVDLKTRKVSTAAGTGQQSHRYRAAGPGPKTALSSPWDVIQVPNTKSLAIAMAGVHEIWRFDIPSQSVASWAGTGEENIRDGLVASALFAQPSGLATDGEHLFVADSEVSAIRAITFGKRPAVHTIVGSGLFVFDDVDGQGEAVRLQHCLGLAYGNGKLYVADSYNNKIKVCDPATKTVETYLGSRQAGKTDDPPRFYQPGGLSVAGWKLYVADTNNSAIRVVDLKERTVQTLELEGLKPPVRRRVPTFPNAVVTDVPEAKVAPGDAITLDVTLPLEQGEKLNDTAPMPYLLETETTGILAPDVVGVGQKVESPSTKFAVKVPLSKPAKAGDSLRLKFSLGTFVCNEKSGLCRVKNYVWTIPVSFTGSKETHVAIEPKAP